MIARMAVRSVASVSAHSSPALAASRQARSRASIPNGRAGFRPTGTNCIGTSIAIDARIMIARGAGKARPPDLPQRSISSTNPPRMTDLAEQDTDHHRHGSVYRVAGPITISRAATTQRELDALPDPLTIDLSEIDRMDTVGAWIIYRTVRDRGAKVIGGTRDEVSLLNHAGE